MKISSYMTSCTTKFNFGKFTFLIYINDFQNCFKNSNVIMYADDTNIFTKEKNINTLYARAQTELINIFNHIYTKHFIFERF